MTKGQEHLLKLLKELDQICRENNIQYFIAGGTLIGAVRHRGFVPWDDDADLYMTRENFLKFVEVAKAGKFPQDRKLECQEMNRKYFNVFARYIDTSATAIHKAQLITEDAAGEVIDILQLDPIPDNKRIQAKHFKRLLVYSDLVNVSSPYLHRQDDARVMYWYYRTLQKLIGKNRTLDILEKKMFSYSEKECSHYFMRWGGTPLIFDKKMFEGEMRVSYEDTETTIPRLYNDYLIYHYGEEWANVPNVSEQMSHVAVHCPHANYKSVQKTYMNVINPRQIESIYALYKNSKIRAARDRHINVDKLTNLRGIRLVEELKKRVSDNKINLQKLYNNGEYDKLCGIFADYYNWQGHSVVSGRDTYVGLYRYSNPILLDLPLPILTIALKTQMDIGRASKSFRTIEIYEKCKGELPEELRVIRDTIQKMRSASTEYSLENFETALVLANQVLENNKNNKPAIIMKIQCMMKLRVEKEKIIVVLKKGLKVFPKDVELRKLRIDLMYGENREEAHKEYLKLQPEIVNGFTRLDLKDREHEYFLELYMKMEAAESENKPEEVRRIYEKVKTLNLTSDEKIKTVEFLTNTELSMKEAVKLFHEVVKYEHVREKEKQKELCCKLLTLAGEEPQVAQVHVDTLLSEDTQLVREKIMAVQEIYNVNENSHVFYQLQKYYADVLYQERKIKVAYELYRLCAKQLSKDTIAYRELCDRLKVDISQMKYLEKIGALDMLNKNIVTKFGSVREYENFLECSGV